DLGAERLYERRAECIAARFHGHATGDRYRRLTALLTETVEVRPSRELTARETSWAQGLYQSAEQNADLLRRVQQQRSRREEGPSLDVASDLIPPSRRDASGRASPTVDQAQPGRPMDAPAHEITSPALSNQGAGPRKPPVGHVKWLVAAWTIRRSDCQRYAPATSPDN